MVPNGANIEAGRSQRTNSRFTSGAGARDAHFHGAEPDFTGLVGGGGVLIMLSSASPNLYARLPLLERFVPLALVEAGHLAAALAGSLGVAPTGNVDPPLARRLMRLFTELHKPGTAVVVATHDRRLYGAGDLILDLHQTVV